METILVKKVNYEVVDRVKPYLVKVTNEGKDYMLYDFSDDIEHFLDFKFAVKRLKTTGVRIPKVIALDKKLHRAVVEYIEGVSPFDMLRESDLDEKIIEQVFNINYKARINRLRLNFSPTKFLYSNNELVYFPFTFSEYVRDEDFTQKEIRLWFYTNEFKKLLIEKGLPVDQSRIKNEYERNKEIVLTVVKYFK